MMAMVWPLPLAVVEPNETLLKPYAVRIWAGV